MTRTKKGLLLLAWLLVATHLYAYLWSTHLDSFPQPPEAVGRWIAQLTGTADSDDIEQLTLYYLLIVSFVITAAFTLAVGAVVAITKKSAARSPAK